ncbi:EF-hand domain-containing protein [Aerolutibacter daejeonensis]|uniref:EF-hand domain-containing protein n=1 Tax=Aerolutibacter daejeonensis TaxID=346181 RepID=UPI00068AAF16|nr:EF-hand domain-containing protein [Lysobacter daejeonensis]
MKRTHLLALALTAVTVSGFAIAHGGADGHDGARPHRMHGERLMQLDTDKDGRISKAEAAARPGLAERFTEMDANKDGFIDKADRQARHAARREAFFAKADANRDGKLTRAELEAAHEARRAEMEARRKQHADARFAQMDTNKDGTISREEMANAPMMGGKRGHGHHGRMDD